MYVCTHVYRFPVPELSEAQRRLPWYHPSLRDEVLHLTLSQLTLTSTLLPHLPQNSSVFDAYFSNANGRHIHPCVLYIHTINVMMVCVPNYVLCMVHSVSEL